MPPKKLKDLSVLEFITTDVSAINTFPYEPRGLLKTPSGGDSKDDTEKELQNYNIDLREADRFVERFAEKQKTSLGWVMAGLIGVLGNLAVNFGFSNPVVGTNLWWMIIALVIVALAIGFYFLFLPRVTMVFRFIPKYKDFPKGYEQYIARNPKLNPYSNIALQFATLNELVRDFGVTVRIALLKDCIRQALEKSSFIRISNIRQHEPFLPYVSVEVSIRGMKPWFLPKVQDKIGSELQEIALAFMNAHQLCSVRAFELDTVEWQNLGADFLDAVSIWSFNGVQNMLLGIIKGQRIEDLVLSASP